ncbi:SDR family oxidoreductase [Brachybacterium sp. ACRRE]|uniref:SDR family oxidoreductase n=1 Tax=Brachybacterium sp. ACRRE TaxID=2918184 RepID=UPI001EF39881|nr:NmrA family NAD(P)-binding protein [Brachybacterium sp. ACRRE]MCG7309384.1 NmrA family NAD(P)-binding protein [Brachybacterium sp. ACRRE]
MAGSARSEQPGEPVPATASAHGVRPARVVVVGGTGTIGAKLVRLLEADGHEVVVASPSTGVDTVTGAGLEEALRGADLVVDTSKPRSFAPEALEAFFTTGIRRLLGAEHAAGVRHHLSLSIVGADRAPDVPFYRAKAGMEQEVRDGGIPWTILHATQFFEFARGIAEAAERADDPGGPGSTTLLPPIQVQPIAGDAVAAHLARLVARILGADLDNLAYRTDGTDATDTDDGTTMALGGDLDIAGLHRMSLAAFVRTALGDDAPPILESSRAPYFGGLISEDTLLPGPSARLIGPSLSEWTSTDRGVC